ncbi:MAG: hypothetical protein ACFNZD_03565, partial [Candidatus Nanoperiomorbus sp.]
QRCWRHMPYCPRLTIRSRFILSQDQTLVKRKFIKTKINLMPKVLAAHAVLSSADHTVKVHPEAR